MPPSLLDPDFSAGDISFTTFQSGLYLHRFHDKKYKPDSFNPGFGKGRFHPIKTKDGNNIPTLYASDCDEGALSEALLRDRVAGDLLYKRELVDKRITVLRILCTLKLADLRGNLLRKLGTTRGALLESDETHYAQTAKWAEMIHDKTADAHGMCWISRQSDISISVLLFKDRLGNKLPSSIELDYNLYSDIGIDMVRYHAEAAGIVLVE